MYKELSLCNIDYTVENGSPIIHLFCRDKEGRQHIVKDSSFRPYFYIRADALYKRPELSNIIGIPPDSLAPYILNVEFGYRGLTRQGVAELAKITCDVPNTVGKLRRTLEKLKPKVETYEADILFVLRYLIDRDIKCGVLYDTENDRVVGPCNNIESNYRCLFVDIEVLANNPRQLRDGTAKCVVIGMYDSFTKQYNIWYTSKQKVKGLSEYFKWFPTELSLLSSFLKIFTNPNTRPDIIFTFTTFDIQFLVKRMLKLGLDYKMLSPIRHVRLESSKQGVFIGGVECRDLGLVYRTFYRKKAKYQTLNEICMNEIGPKYKKRELPYSSVAECWSHSVKDVLLYNLRDVYLIKKLESVTQLLETIDTIRRLVGVRLSDTLYPSRITDVLYLRLLHGRVVLPSRPVELPEHKDELSYTGAEVFECKKGVYENVLGLDWSSMYPSTIRAFNIGYNTWDPYYGELAIDDRHRFMSYDEDTSWTVQILDIVQPLLVENKRLIKEAESKGDKQLVSRLEAMRLGLKAIVHACYGYYAFKGDPDKGQPASRLLNIPIAESITMVPRILQKEGVIQAARKLGYEVIYGDSVPYDTPVVVKYENGQVDIITIEELYMLYKRGRQLKALDKDGFTEVLNVYRRRANKTLYTVYCYGGMVEATEDHSIIINSCIAKPKEIKIGKDRATLVGLTLPDNITIDNEVAWLLGLFVARGSSSAWRGKWQLHIDSKDKELLEKASRIFETKLLASTSIGKVKGGIFRLYVNPARVYGPLFRALCYNNRGLKRVPLIILNGSVDNKRSFICGYLSPRLNTSDIIIASDSKILVAGVKALLDSLGIVCTIRAHWKHNIAEMRVLKTNNHSLTKEREIVKCVRARNFTGYVYDITTSSGTFAAGIGNVLLHNTDSFYIRLHENDDPNTVRDKFQREIESFIINKWGVNPEHFKLDVDVHFKRAIFLTKKRYCGLTVTGRIVNKGLDLVRRNESYLTAETQAGLIEAILNNKPIEEIRAFLASQILKIYTYPLEKIAIPASLRKPPEQYDVASIHLKAFVFSRDYLGIPLEPGERFYYVLIKPIGIKCSLKLKGEDKEFYPTAIAFNNPSQIKGKLTMKTTGTLLRFFNTTGVAKVKVRIDREAMINRTIKKKVMPFLKLLNISWDEILEEVNSSLDRYKVSIPEM